MPQLPPNWVPGTSGRVPPALYCARAIAALHATALHPHIYSDVIILFYKAHLELSIAAKIA